ncbi:MAG: hypothetical protein AB7O96_11760 [Pseudobdellovibrionaceae bacterium]
MSELITLLVPFFLSSPSFALVDSHKVFPTKLSNWTVTSTHMDTGDLRHCSAKGTSGDLEISITSPFGSGSRDISFRFVKGMKAPAPRSPGDQRPCGSGKDQAPSGSWHYSSQRSNEEYCDGKSWVKLTAETFKNATLLLNGKEITKASEGANFKMGLIAGKPVLFEYGAWFQQIDGFEKKFSWPGKVELLIDSLGSGPIGLGDLSLDQVSAELARCERERK